MLFMTELLNVPMTNSDLPLSLSDTNKHWVSKGLSSCAGSLVLLGNTSSFESTEPPVLAPLSCTGFTNTITLLLEWSKHKSFNISRIIKRHANKVDSTTITVSFKTKWLATTQNSVRDFEIQKKFPDFWISHGFLWISHEFPWISMDFSLTSMDFPGFLNDFNGFLY